MRVEYEKLNKVELSIWECCELLNNVVDDSDPDIEEPQIEHLLQTAEAIRKDYPNEDWLHLTALVHGILVFSLMIMIIDVHVHNTSILNIFIVSHIMWQSHEVHYLV